MWQNAAYSRTLTRLIDGTNRALAHTFAVPSPRPFGWEQVRIATVPFPFG